MAKIRLTDAQVSAIECRPIDEPDFPGKLVGNHLVYMDAEAMREWLCEASNAEDEWAEYRKQSDKESALFARRASASLAAVMMKVSKQPNN